MKIKEIKKEIKKTEAFLIKQSIPPSFFVKLMTVCRAWGNVNFCTKCGLMGKSEDFHKSHPCPRCGCVNIKEKIGRWVQTGLDGRGFWQMKKDT